jgi:Mitochondrial 18 KDa protein (MTP18)
VLGGLAGHSKAVAQSDAARLTLTPGSQTCHACTRRVAAGAHHEPATSSSSEEAAAAAPYDPLRDGPLRFCGYANECGEAFAAWLPAFGVPASYAIAIAYVLVDTYDKAAAAHRDAVQLQTPRASDASDASDAGVSANVARGDLGRLVALLTTERAVDTLLWQLLASVAIPGFTIHQIVAATHAALLLGTHLDRPDALPPALAPAVAAVASAAGVSAGEVRSLLRALRALSLTHLLLCRALLLFLSARVCRGRKAAACAAARPANIIPML